MDIYTSIHIENTADGYYSLDTNISSMCRSVLQLIDNL